MTNKTILSGMCGRLRITNWYAYALVKSPTPNSKSSPASSVLRRLVLSIGAVACSAIAPVFGTESEGIPPSPNVSDYTIAIQSYLEREFDFRIEHVKVFEKEIEVNFSNEKRVNAFEDDSSVTKHWLVGLPMHWKVTDPITDLHRIPVEFHSSDTPQSIRVARFRSSEDRNAADHKSDAPTNSSSGETECGVDQALFRWAIATESDSGSLVLNSHTRYADEIPALREKLEPHVLKSKKGLGGWTHNRGPGLNSDIADLGISAVTVNIGGLHNFLSLTPKLNHEPYVWQGQTYYFQPSRLANYDKIMLEAAKHDVMVSAILLVTVGAGTGNAEAQLLSHPDATRDGHYAMPNVLDQQGLNFYGAIVNLLAERWSREDGKYGRVHHWILHNEVDFGWIWTNAGKKSDVEYMDMYHRSMRLVHLISRSYDPNSVSFISLTHHWSVPGEPYAYGSRRMLELLQQFCKAEGDFEWGLAHHPYPQDLFEPRTWEDDQAIFDWDTPKLTPKNLEVLDAYMRQPDLLFNGKVRKIHLSENGFNSRDYSDKSLEDQAAGMAVAWHKVKQLPSIELWHYHNWVDHPDEGGLRIGLRKFPKAAQDPYGKKPIWYLYQACGTENEEQVLAPYLKTIGIEKWSDLEHNFTPETRSGGN